MITHLGWVCYTQVYIFIWNFSFGIFIQLAWKSQIDFKWIRSLVSKNYTVLRWVSIPHKFTSLECGSFSREKLDPSGLPLQYKLGMGKCSHT